MGEGGHIDPTDFYYRITVKSRKLFDFSIFSRVICHDNIRLYYNMHSHLGEGGQTYICYNMHAYFFWGGDELTCVTIRTDAPSRGGTN